ncbi:endolytic transglycosylase MltG [Puia dinghuensis]|uniref:Endolytic murein transglycosylase n=1 Tax=Puia dinghuensis TaxID=1792502 RepID=A0A8J2U826_9BACT|nr:endolytic transglycosylase MltG [Puia dinghuensis]GGA85611.1 aminodeoxychorismate lyase [Puia dinghuensis]
MKKFILGFVLILLVVGVFAGWRLFGSATAFSGENYYLYIHNGMTYEQVLDTLKEENVLKSPAFFNFLAARMDYPQNVRAGKYEIKRGMSLLAILRMLHNGRQVPVKIVITKFRTLEGLASAIGKKLECDSADLGSYLHNNDSLQAFGLDSNTVMAMVVPNTYTYFWNTAPSGVFRKMYTAYKAWWTPDRIEAAKARGLTPVTATILASIVEEETTVEADKGKIASVYLNRMAKGIRLSADPTIKYALRDFDLRRIYDKYLLVESPYNTYQHEGLPPGPICTPSEATLKDVLASPATDYLYFVAKPDFSGYSNFAATYKEHLAYAKAYRDALDKQQAIKAGADSLKK